MLFNSVAFAIFFPVVLAIYWGLRTPKRQNAFLVAASLFFYGWWDYRFLSLLLVSTLTDYLCARKIGDDQKAGDTGKRWLVLSLVVNLGLLGVFKYYNFFVGSAERLWTSIGWRPDLLKVALPIGISFYTFQTLSYTVDVYRGKFSPRRSLVDVAAYVTFFPQLVAGPIERATTLIPQLEKQRTINAEQIRLGLMLMLVGFFKKLVLADGVAPLANEIFNRAARGESVSAAEALLGAYVFSIQIYGDFSGYSNIARGAARLLGINLVINFRQPYFARSYSETWNRWHISLSTWMRDYIYFPMGGSRGTKATTLRNLAATMFLGGLWHGAAWTYVFWGGFVGVALVLERLTNQHDPTEWGKPYRALRIVITFHLWALSMVFFRADTITTAWRMIATWGGPWTLPAAGILWTVGLFGLLLVLIDLPNLVHPEEELPAAERPRWMVFTVALAVAGFVVVPPLDTVQFIYFQF